MIPLRKKPQKEIIIDYLFTNLSFQEINNKDKINGPKFGASVEEVRQRIIIELQERGRFISNSCSN